MRLAICHPFLYVKGGAERVVLKIAKHFDAKIYCALYEPEKTFPEFGDCDIEVLKTRFFRYMPGGVPIRVRHAVAAGRIFYHKVLPGDYDVINAQGTPSEWIRHYNSPVVWYSHSPNREAFDLYEARMKGRRLHEKALYWGCLQAYRLLENRTVPKIERIFANSANTQWRLKHYLGVESEVLHPGVDAENYYCAEYREFFFYPSRITPEKRFEYAIDAFREFRKSSPRFRDWKLVIAGSLFADRPEHAAYYEWLKNYLGSDGRIVVDADQERLSSLYARCFAVLYSPMNEDFGIVPLEALSSEKPVISVNEGGPKEVVSDGENGFLVNSPGEMAEKMAFLAERPELAEEMGKNGRRLVETRFTWKAFLDRFEAVCRKVKKLDAPPA
ncbi:MAG: glycosyltransferase [Candidatus ainarchaeum sp.]|nr:glycosyltransferase [Candidatus ainarchaeum sp.]